MPSAKRWNCGSQKAEFRFCRALSNLLNVLNDLNHPSSIPRHMGLIAGKGTYPALWIEAARRAGVESIHMAAFEGETPESTSALADSVEWMRVGQLGRLIQFFKAAKVSQAVMAGQITPSRLFDLRPDLKAVLLLARLKERNAESLFGAIADELAKAGVELLLATTFLEDSLSPAGWFGGPKPCRGGLEDLVFGWKIAKEISRLNIGQTIVVRNGTVLAVEAFEGTNDAMRRGGAIGKGKAVVIKVSKPGQDLRFDVPVIGLRTLEVAQEAGVLCIGIEAGSTLLLEKEALLAAAKASGISLYGIRDRSDSANPGTSSGNLSL